MCLEAAGHMVSPEDMSVSRRSPTVTLVDEIGQTDLPISSDLIDLVSQKQETIPSVNPSEPLILAAQKARSTAPVDHATARITPYVCIPKPRTAREPSKANDRPESSTVTVNESELRMLEEIRGVQARHLQCEPPQRQVISDRMRSLDTLIVEAVSHFMTPHHDAAFSFTRLTLTSDAATLSELLFGHQPHVNAGELIATALDMQWWKHVPTTVLVRAYIAAALNQWVFRAELRHGWYSTNYRARKIEDFICRGQSIAR